MYRNLALTVIALNLLVLPVLFTNCSPMKGGSAALDASSPAAVNVGSPSGFDAFTKTLYPFVRTTCVGCHGSVQFPRFADPDPQFAYAQALTRVNLMNVSQSVFMIKIRDGHCGVACQSDGTQMLGLLTQWVSAEQLPTATTIPTTTTTSAGSFSPVGTAGLKNFKQYPQGLLSLLGKTANGSDMYFNSYRHLEYRLSADSDPLSLSPPMLTAYATVSSFFCRGFLDAERASAASSRKVFTYLNFGAAPSAVSTATRQQIVQDLSLLLWKRPATTNEEMILTTFFTDITTGVPDNSSQTYNMILGLCVTMAGSLDSIRL